MFYAVTVLFEREGLKSKSVFYFVIFSGVVTALPVKIFFQNDSYKTVFVEPEWTARILIDKVCEKLGMEKLRKANKVVIVF
jgi:hypothetical protein